MQRMIPIIGFVLVVLGVLVGQTLFVVYQTDQAIVLRFGDPQRVITEPGLQAKVPFIDEVRFIEKRVLNLDPPKERVILSDQKRVEVDTLARYLITDALKYFQTLRTEQQAKGLLNRTVNDAMRGVLGNVTLADILSPARDQIMVEIRDKVNAEVARFGIDIVDVRIGRADLPPQTSQAIFNRMRSEREREAAEARAQGEELAQQIRSRADKERTVLLAEAERDAQAIRGEGDEQAIEIYARAFSRDPEFYSFYRSMEAYRNSLREDGTTLVLSPNSDFFQFFGEKAPDSWTPRPTSLPPEPPAESTN